MSPTLPQPAPLQVQTLEAGKGLARLDQAEQPLDRGSVLSHLGAGLHHAPLIFHLQNVT